MCGIFGFVGSSPLDRASVRLLTRHAQQRGVDSSGLMVHDGRQYCVYRADWPVTRLVRKVGFGPGKVFFGHSRLVTHGMVDNQPIERNGVYVIHNGIVVNHEALWDKIGKKREREIDTEVIAAIVEHHLETSGDVHGIASSVMELCEGVVACVVVLPEQGKLVLFSNNGSLYIGTRPEGRVFASESYALTVVGCTDVQQVRESIVLDIPAVAEESTNVEWKDDRATTLVPQFALLSDEESMLTHRMPNFSRCSRCILPSTMPFIRFDENGLCNYCLNYKERNNPRSKAELFELVAPYRRPSGADCLVPFSGGRDSSYALHLIVTELEMRPITYTYDWGMLTDLGRRNISRMCAGLGVENIIVADDIRKKRRFIAMNLRAWLKSPHLGMVSVLTAGDKHFFRHIETVKKQTEIGLNLWGINPLEVTHFKAGFLGIPPDFEEQKVYSSGATKQLRYQALRFKAMLRSPQYFNPSLWDTLSGEYFRSFASKSDYFHIFDYWRWDENLIEDTLDSYDWERSPDTRTTWRIGDATAAFYNYVYYTVAGFSEHDTFRSNQVREGDLTRDEALALVSNENQPRYPNIKWYLDALGFDFKDVISTVNAIHPLYET